MIKDRNYPVEPTNLNLDRLIGQIRENPNHLELGIMKTASLSIVNLGRYAKATGQLDSARKCFEIALELDRNNTFANQGLAQLK